MKISTRGQAGQAGIDVKTGPEKAERMRGKVEELRFTKLQGAGNDFLIIPTDYIEPLEGAPALARVMCERKYGAGADGIVFVAPSAGAAADFSSRIFNSDGSEAEVSGNGTRCAAAFLHYTKRWSEPRVRIDTAAGIKTGELVARSGARFDFEFDMGEPRFSSLELPMNLDRPLPKVVAYGLMLGGEIFEVTCVSMGNPHCTLFIDDLESLNLEEIGPLIEDHPVFPNRTNVEFARVISPEEIEVMFWERGVGRTLSSGTGSCGAAVAAMLNGFTARAVNVRTGGGTLRIEWRDDNHVALTGSAEVLYEGLWLRDSES
ncbi:MAG TPA: diaminopimelate epimerase [Blastocatellia bacterium]|nr:diaminopimelate epimerase [Blastocatellia bacterium]